MSHRSQICFAANRNGMLLKLLHVKYVTAK